MRLLQNEGGNSEKDPPLLLISEMYKISGILKHIVVAGVLVFFVCAYAGTFPGSIGNGKNGDADLTALCKSNLSSVAFCVIDGEAITAEYVRDIALMVAKITELSGKKVPANAIPVWGNNFAMEVTPSLISSKLLSKEADRLGIKPTAGSDAETLAKFNRQTRSRARTKDELAERFGSLKQVFLRNFESESQRTAYFDTLPELKVADGDVDAYYLNLTNRLKKLSKLDAIAREKGRKVEERLAAGDDWAAIASKYSEDALVDKENEIYSKEWGLFRIKDLQPLELSIAVAMLETNKWTRPIETDDGLVVAKLLNREGDSVSLARILIRLPIRLEVPSREVAERRIKQEKCGDFQRKLLPKLYEQAKIEYPLGTNFIYRIWNVPEKGKRQGSRKPRKPRGPRLPSINQK